SSPSTPSSPHLRTLPSFPTRRSSDLCDPRSDDHTAGLQEFAAFQGQAEACMIGVDANDLSQVEVGHGVPPEPVPIVDEAIKWNRSEEHTSELQSRENLVCRLLLEKKK